MGNAAGSASLFRVTIAVKMDVTRHLGADNHVDAFEKIKAPIEELLRREYAPEFLTFDCLKSEVLCPTCQGMGRWDKDHKNEPCLVCRGSGKTVMP